MSSAAGIQVRDLTKHYGPVVAVRAAGFDVAPGEIFGLLGVNGAGKTTIIECLLGLRQPDAGAITLDGIDARTHPREARRRVGAQLQSAALQDRITPRQALGLFASFYPAAAPVTLNYGSFLQAFIDFTLIALVLFFLVSFVNRLHRRPSAEPAPLTADQQLLTEIRDELRRRNDAAKPLL